MKTINIIKNTNRAILSILTLTIVLFGLNSELMAQASIDVPLTVEVDSTENIILKIYKPLGVNTNRIFVKAGSQPMGEDIYKKTFKWGDVANPNNTEISADQGHILVLLDTIPTGPCHFNVMLHCGETQIYVGRMSQNLSELNNQ